MHAGLNASIYYMKALFIIFLGCKSVSSHSNSRGEVCLLSAEEPNYWSWVSEAPVWERHIQLTFTSRFNQLLKVYHIPSGESWYQYIDSHEPWGVPAGAETERPLQRFATSQWTIFHRGSLWRAGSLWKKWITNVKASEWRDYIFSRFCIRDSSESDQSSDLTAGSARVNATIKCWNRKLVFSSPQESQITAAE